MNNNNKKTSHSPDRCDREDPELTDRNTKWPLQLTVKVKFRVDTNNKEENKTRYHRFIISDMNTGQTGSDTGLHLLSQSPLDVVYIQSCALSQEVMRRSAEWGDGCVPIGPEPPGNTKLSLSVWRFVCSWVGGGFVDRLEKWNYYRNPITRSLFTS